MSGAVWDELVATALVGTARRPVPGEVRRHVEQALGAPAPADDRADPVERAVLTAAGVMAAERRAGIRTPEAGPPPPPAVPADPRPEPSAAAVQLLELVLGGAAGLGGSAGATAGTALVVEWLDRVAATGRVVPRRLLPALLDHAATAAEVREPLLAAGGPAGPWLAARNPSWAWAATTDAGTDPAARAETWRTGTGDARFAALAAVRADDPAAGRALLEETWTGERAADRARAVQTLAADLTDDDEALLETALDDRAASVRTAAAAVLGRRPGSARALRMADRLRPLVTVSPPDPRTGDQIRREAAGSDRQCGEGVGRLRRTLAVELPGEPDAAARRDGIVDAGAPPATGRRAWWLTQIVAGTPLALWTDELGLSPGTTADLAQAHAELLLGLTAATVLQADATWAAALAGHHPTAALLALLPPDRARDLVTRALRTAADAAVPGLLATAPGPWPAPFTVGVTYRLQDLQNTMALQQALATVAVRGHPDAGPALEAWIATLGDAETRRRLVRSTTHTLSIRRAITQELP
ncbi:MAG TPA: DUF5691 domain-containing protein [Iamia sp.]|nr:DUF5691 domain-containing protein [Iamia sp.]